MTSRARTAGALLLAAIAAGACGPRDAATTARSRSNPSEHAAGVDTSARARPDTGRARADTTRARQPGELATVRAAPVEGWVGPDERPFEVTLRTREPASVLARRFGVITLATSLRSRTPDVGQYPCTSCHLGRRIVMSDERVTDAHQNIQPLHPKQTGAACATCHSSDDVELLSLKSGERATLDHAYRLCAQCHFEQAEAWAGGGHGKRLDGWQGRRVVMGCADCHDPHRPALVPRIPFRAPSLTRPRSQEP